MARRERAELLRMQGPRKEARWRNRRTVVRVVNRRASLECSSRPVLSELAGDAQFLFRSMGPSPMANTGGFRVNYDYETPIRSIDLGGPDQEQR